jgi:hypothetical protein
VLTDNETATADKLSLNPPRIRAEAAFWSLSENGIALRDN